MSRRCGGGGGEGRRWVVFLGFGMVIMMARVVFLLLFLGFYRLISSSFQGVVGFGLREV